MSESSVVTDSSGQYLISILRTHPRHRTILRNFDDNQSVCCAIFDVGQRCWRVRMKAAVRATDSKVDGVVFWNTRGRTLKGCQRCLERGRIDRIVPCFREIDLVVEQFLFKIWQ